jgi:hypothetical protein
MGHDAPMNQRQRTVVVIASGLALAVVAVTVNRLLADPAGGWFAYAPNTGVSFASRGSKAWLWREAAIGLATIAAWTAIAFRLYRNPPTS